MRKSIIASALAVALAIPGCKASAADLGKPKNATPDQIMAMRDQPVRPINCGVAFGGGFGVSPIDVKEDGAKVPFGPTGALIALGAGCDYRIAGFSLGGFATYHLGEMESKAVIDGSRLTMTTSGLWNLGARLGYYVQDTTLLYGKVGLAGMKAEAAGGGDHLEKRFLGTLVGIGVETKIVGPVWLRTELDAYFWSPEALSGAKVEAKSGVGLMSLIYRF